MKLSCDLKVKLNIWKMAASNSDTLIVSFLSEYVFGFLLIVGFSHFSIVIITITSFYFLSIHRVCVFLLTYFLAEENIKAQFARKKHTNDISDPLHIFDFIFCRWIHVVTEIRTVKTFKNRPVSDTEKKILPWKLIHPVSQANMPNVVTARDWDPDEVDETC